MRAFLQESFVPVLAVLAVLSGALVVLRHFTEVRSESATVIRIQAADVDVERSDATRAPLRTDADADADVARSPWVERLLAMAARDSIVAAQGQVQARLDRNPHDSGAWFARAVLASRSGHSAAAIEAYRQAIEYSTGRARAVPLFNLASLYHDLDRKPEAEDALRRAVDLRPGYLQARLNLAILVASTPARHGEARKMYEQIIRLAPDYPEAWYNRGVLDLAQGQLDSARVDLERCVRLDSLFTKAWLNLGVVHSRAGRGADAEHAYRRALAVDPNHQRARLNLAILLGNRPNGHAEAYRLYEQLVKSTPDYAEAYNGRGALEMDDGDLPAAQRDFETAVKLDPKFAKAWFHLGTLHGKAGRSDAAIAAYRGAILADANYTKARVNLAVHLARAKRYAEAADINREIVREDPSYSRAWNNLAIAEAHLDAFDAAETAYRKVIELDPDNARAWQNLGALFARRKKLDKAIECYHEALAIEPTNVAARYNLALAFSRQGRLDLANQEITRLAHIGADDPKAQRLLRQFTSLTDSGRRPPIAAADATGDDDANGK